MPTSWSASGSGAALCCYSSSRRGSRGTVFLFPDLQRRTDSLESQGTMSVELNVLDEVAETELSPGATTAQGATVSSPPPPQPASMQPIEGDHHRRRQMVRATAICHREATMSFELEPNKRGSMDPVVPPQAASTDLPHPDQPQGPEETMASEFNEGSRDSSALHHSNQVRGTLS